MIVAWVLLALFALVAGFYMAAYSGLFLAHAYATYVEWRTRRRAIVAMLHDMDRVEWIVASWGRGQRGR